MRDPDAWIDVVAPVLGLAIDEDWRPGVRQFLSTAAAMAEIVAAVPLDDAELALAPVFRLPPPPGE